MFSLFIRYFFIILSTIYSYYKIKNMNYYKKEYLITNIVFSISTSFIISLFYNKDSLFRLLIIFSFLLIFITLSTNTTIRISLPILIISLAISLITLALSTALISIFIIFSSNNTYLISIPSIFIIGILQLLLVFYLFKIKRLQKGMPFLLKHNIITIGLIPPLCIITLFCLIQFYFPQTSPSRLLILFTILFLALLLLIWWRRKITQSYVEKLRISEVEALYKEISDKDLEIEKLHVNNDELARIIHKDNKLIPAMELAVRNYLQAADSMTLEDVKQMGKDLLTHLEHMSEDRQGIIHTYQEKTAYHQRCGLASIDAIVDYMEKRASDLGIEYHYQYDKDIKEKLSAYINETDAMHLLSDIIENAIIATTDQDKKMICVHIGFIQDILFMDISDSGIAFDPETYQNFGILKSTTHADHGGSGIGLMDLGRLKKQYKFSLQIYEYSPDSSDYTKKIRLLFDKKNHYLIQSYRAKEISSIVTRNDLHIFSSNNKEQRLFHI